MRIEPLGDSALLVRVVEDYGREPEKAPDVVLDAFRKLEEASLSGVIELAPAYATVGVFFDPARTGLAALRTEIEQVLQNLEPARLPAATGSTIEVPVCYEDEFAPDLREVAWHTRLSAQQVIRKHAETIYRVNCVGFSPGFPYLSGLPNELSVPRRASPRKEVPTGSVAIGGKQTGIYSVSSPGGWNVIGRTPLRIFDPAKEPPALLRAGDCVRFRPVTREEFE